jgi:hypothetical protein
MVGDDESSTSSNPTPVSFGSNAPDSPVFYRQSTIEVPVMDALSAQRSQSPAQSHLHPPTILLEIPGNINKCLSPIHEMPTPMPSPALTPVMPRTHHRLAHSPQVQDETISVTLSDDEDKNVIIKHTKGLTLPPPLFLSFPPPIIILPLIKKIPILIKLLFIHFIYSVIPCLSLSLSLSLPELVQL